MDKFFVQAGDKKTTTINCVPRRTSAYRQKDVSSLLLFCMGVKLGPSL